MSMHADTPPTSHSEVPEGMHGDIHALSDHCLIRQLGQHASNGQAMCLIDRGARNHRGGLHGCTLLYSMVAKLGN